MASMTPGTLTIEEARLHADAGYASARSVILGLWRANPKEYLSIEAVQAAARSMPDSDALPEGSLREAHTFLTRRGRINLGMDVPPPPVVVPEPEGPAGSPPPPTLKQIKKALYGILRTVDFNVTSEKGIRGLLSKELGGISVEEHKPYIKIHVQYVIDRMDQRETLKPLADEGEDPDDDDEGVEAGKAKTTRVLVVGAGAAGLAAASVLAKAGTEVVVLEAKDVWGGRSRPHTSTQVEEQLTLVAPELVLLLPSGGDGSGTGHCVASVLAAQRDLDLIPLTGEGSGSGAGMRLLRVKQNGDGVEEVDADITQQADRLLADALSTAALPPPAPLTSASETPRAASLGDALKVALAGKVRDSGESPASSVLDVLGWRLRCMELSAGAPIDRLPVSMAVASSAITSTPSSLPRSSTSLREVVLRRKAGSSAAVGVETAPVPASELLEGLTKGLDLRYNSCVKSVTYGKKGVTLVTESGEEFRGDFAVLSVPLSVLQSESIAFQPDLPAWKSGALSRLGCGFGGFVVLQYDSPFWDPTVSTFGLVSTTIRPSPTPGGVVPPGSGSGAEPTAPVETVAAGLPSAASGPTGEAPAASAEPLPGGGGVDPPPEEAPSALEQTLASPATLKPVLLKVLPALSPSSSSLLVQFAGGDSACWMATSPEALKAVAIEAVHLAFPDAEPVLRAAHVSRWGPAGKQQYEPYSYMKADAEPVDVTALSVPIKGRLCFAGDYTVSVDGALGPLGSRLHCALESGVREAGRVLAAVDAAEKTKSKGPPVLGPVDDELEFDIKSLALREEQLHPEEEEEEDDDQEEDGDEDGEGVRKRRSGKKRGARGDDGGAEKKKRSRREGDEVKKAGRTRAAAEAVDAMDRPGGLGEYDPQRAAAELARRQEARQDIKAAHKALIQASSGNVDPLKEVLSGCDGSGAMWDIKTQLAKVLAQASPEALSCIAGDLSVLKTINEWLEDCFTHGSSFAESLIGAILAMVARLPLARLSIIRSSGIPKTLRSRLVDAPHKGETEGMREARRLAEESLAKWMPPKQQLQRPNPPPSIPPGSKPKAVPPAPTPASAPTSLPSNTDNLSRFEIAKAKIAQLKAETERKAAERDLLLKERAKLSHLPEVSTFSDFRKIEHKTNKMAAGGAPAASSSALPSEGAPPPGRGGDLKPAAPIGTSVGAHGASEIGSKSGVALSGDALVKDYVKHQLGPHVKDKSITREQYEKIKEGVVRKVISAHSSIDSSFFKSSDHRHKVKKLIQQYIQQYKK